MVGLIIPAKPTVIYDQTVAAVTQVDIANLAGFKWLKLTANLTVSAGQGLALRTSTDNGSTFLSAAGSYQWIHTGSSGLSSASDTLLQMGDNTLSTARFIEAEIQNMFNANQITTVHHKVMHSNPFIYTGLGARLAATADNALRLLVNGAGNFSGRITLEGI